MALVTISQMMTDRVAQSEVEVTVADGGLDDYENIKLRAITMAKWWVYGEDKNEDDIIDYRVREYIALVALARLIPALIDWFRNKRRLTDSKQGSSHTYYDHVTELRIALAQVKADYLALKPEVQTLIWDTEATGRYDTIKASTELTHESMPLSGSDIVDYMVTLDPFAERFPERSG